MYVVLMFRKLTELITHLLHESPLEKLQWVTLLNNPLTAQLPQVWKFGMCSSWKGSVLCPSSFLSVFFFLMNAVSCL